MAQPEYPDQTALHFAERSGRSPKRPEMHPLNLIRFVPAEGSDLYAAALVQLQLDHNVWATRQLIAAARPLAPSAFDQDLGIGPGSLRVTFAHVIASMFFFAANFAGKRYEEPADFKLKSTTPDGLIELLERAATELSSVMLPFVERAGTGTSVPWPSAKSGSLPAFAAVAQVFDHGTHHRAQCKHMLKRHGLTQLPPTDPLSMDDLRRAAAR